MSNAKETISWSWCHGHELLFQASWPVARTSKEIHHCDISRSSKTLEWGLDVWFSQQYISIKSRPVEELFEAVGCYRQLCIIIVSLSYFTAQRLSTWILNVSSSFAHNVYIKFQSQYSVPTSNDTGTYNQGTCDSASDSDSMSNTASSGCTHSLVSGSGASSELEELELLELELELSWAGGAARPRGPMARKDEDTQWFTLIIWHKTCDKLKLWPNLSAVVCVPHLIVWMFCIWFWTTWLK